MLYSLFRSVAGGAALLCLAASVCAPIYYYFCDFFYHRPFLSPLLPCILVSRRGFHHPTPRRPAHLLLPERIWCLLTGSSPPCRFPRRYASFGAMTLGTNGLTCGFNWQCTAEAIVYAVMVAARLKSLSCPHFHGLNPPRPRGSRGSREK